MKIFDSHFHIINPNYPLIRNHGYIPSDFTAEDYQNQVKDFSIEGGAIISGSFQGFHQEYLLDSLQKFGANYYGVANIPLEMGSADLKKLNRWNIRGVRFNLKRGGSESLKNMVRLSNKLFDLFGWHSELYVDSKDLKTLHSKLRQIPRFSIDHLGISKSGLRDLYYWADQGVKIKATGFGRVNFNPISAMKKIYSINPESLMFGTDLPSTRAREPFSHEHLKRIQDNFSDKALEKILYLNAKNWYSKP